MMMRDLLSVVKIVKCDNGHAAGTSLVTSSTVDTAGYDAALILCDLAAFVDAGVATLQAQDGAASNGLRRRQHLGGLGRGDQRHQRQRPGSPSTWSCRRKPLPGR